MALIAAHLNAEVILVLTMCACVYMRACVRAFVRACVRACVCICVCVCVWRHEIPKCVTVHSCYYGPAVCVTYFER